MRAMPTVSKWRSTDFGKLILRLGLAAILLFHGIYKIFHGVAWIKPLLAQIGLPTVQTLPSPRSTRCLPQISTGT